MLLLVPLVLGPGAPFLACLLPVAMHFAPSSVLGQVFAVPSRKSGPGGPAHGESLTFSFAFSARRPLTSGLSLCYTGRSDRPPPWKRCRRSHRPSDARRQLHSPSASGSNRWHRTLFLVDLPRSVPTLPLAVPPAAQALQHFAIQASSGSSL